jgi:hypothetical protein
MSQLLVVLVIVVVSIIVALVAKRRNPSSFEHFWEDFWPNFFSDLVVGILIAVFLAWVLTAGEKVEAKVVLEMTSVESGIKMGFSVDNVGDVAFKADEIYWHVWVDNKLDIEERGDKAPKETVEVLDDRTFLYFQSLLDGPVFPGRRTKLFTITVSPPESGQYVIYYLLSTVHGVFPKPSRIKRGATSDLGKIVWPVEKTP